MIYFDRIEVVNILSASSGKYLHIEVVVFVCLGVLLHSVVFQEFARLNIMVE
jgi:hypothetical protein